MNEQLDKTNIGKKDIPNIDAQTGALILIDMLYQQKMINKKTYDNIQMKYNNTKNSLKQIS